MQFFATLQHAERTLDALAIVDDSNLNFLDWSDSNVILIVLGNALYLWDANMRTSSELLMVDDDDGPINSVNWAPSRK